MEVQGERTVNELDGNLRLGVDALDCGVHRRSNRDGQRVGGDRNEQPDLLRGRAAHFRHGPG